MKGRYITTQIKIVVKGQVAAKPFSTLKTLKTEHTQPATSLATVQAA